MKFYRESHNSPNKLVCLLCQHYCHLLKDQVGICGVNKNVGEKIECLVYGHTASVNIDPIEKKPLYHFLPSSKSLSLGTVGCNFKCPFCQNWGISQENRIDKSRYYSSQDIVRASINNRCESISYTYNEPTIFYPYARDIAVLAKANGIKNVYVSNGFESDEVIDDMVGIIDAINIDLKSFDEKYYKKELGGNLLKLLKNIKHFKQNGIWVEITTLIVPTKNDSSDELEKIARFIADEVGCDTPWHISAFHPDYQEQTLPRTSFESLKKAYDIGKKAGLKYVYMGNIGYENSTKCSWCDEVLIARKGFFVESKNIVNSSCPKCSSSVSGIFE
jgi:pyruvate formate lyase activating enzyme